MASEIVAVVQQPQLEATEITTRTKARLALALIAQLLPLVEQIAAYDKEITQLFLSHADNAIFESLPRAGKRLAPRLLAEIGDDWQRYADATKLQALAGTAPVIFQSGTYTRIHRRYACVKPLRWAGSVRADRGPLSPSAGVLRTIYAGGEAGRCFHAHLSSPAPLARVPPGQTRPGTFLARKSASQTSGRSLGWPI